MNQQDAILQDHFAWWQKRKKSRNPTVMVESPALRADLNVTPLVDVVLVLLIIFMVVTPALVQAVPLLLPETHPQETKSPEKIFSLSLGCKPIDETRSDCTQEVLYHQGKSISLHELPALLAKEIPPGPARPALELQADRRLPYGAVQKVLLGLEQAGFYHVQLGSKGTS